MHGRRLGLMLSVALTFALCCGPAAHPQSGRVRKSRRPEARAGGLSGREVKTRPGVAPGRRGETEGAEGPSRGGEPRSEVPSPGAGRRVPAAHALDPEHITFAVIMVMLIVILTSGRV